MLNYSADVLVRTLMQGASRILVNNEVTSRLSRRLGSWKLLNLLENEKESLTEYSLEKPYAEVKMYNRHIKYFTKMFSSIFE